MSTISNERKIKRFYSSEAVAERYVGQRFVSEINRLLHDRQVAAVNTVMKSLKPKRVLEIAPGPGRITRGVRLSQGILCLEYNQKMIEHGRLACNGKAVWVRGDGPAQQMAEAYGLPHHQCDSMRLLTAGKFQMVMANFRLGRALRSYGKGIVHVHWPLGYGALQSGLRLSRLKRVVHVQLEEDPGGLRWALKHPPEMIITCAKYLVDYVRRLLPDGYQERQRIVAVPNAVDTEQFFPGDKAEAKRRTKAAADVPLILMIANLAPHKGQQTAIRAVAELKHRGVHVACWLAGIERDGTKAYISHLYSLISELGVSDRVQLLGYRHDAPELLRAADFFLLPSTQEGLPLSVLEAQATKVPVLASPTAGVPELVADGRTGFLISAVNYLGYADRIQDLLSNRALYFRVTENAYDQVRRENDWSIYRERIWALYRELLHDEQRKPPVPDSLQAGRVGEWGL